MNQLPTIALLANEEGNEEKPQEKLNENDTNPLEEVNEMMEERLTMVAQNLLVRLYNESAFDINFMIMVITASMVSAAGFLMNNPVIIVASMLISPIMGPILGMSFGSIIRDWKLVRKAVWTESGGIVLCLLVGIVFGICGAPFAKMLGLPGLEMLSRGEYVNLVFGVIIAVPSGVAVGLSLIIDNVASLVGVAISASLLPPLVDSGILFGFAFMEFAIPGLMVDPRFTPVELFVKGVISFILFLINILCIYAAAYGMFQINAHILNKSGHEDAGDGTKGNQILHNVEDYVYSVTGKEREKLSKLVKARPGFALDEEIRRRPVPDGSKTTTNRFSRYSVVDLPGNIVSGDLFVPPNVDSIRKKRRPHSFVGV